MTVVKIDVEYCDSCGHKKQFLEMSKMIKDTVSEVEILGMAGRQGSYEIKINDVLVHSKLQTMSFPDFTQVCDIIKDISEGKPVRKVDKQQPINCTLM